MRTLALAAVTVFCAAFSTPTANAQPTARTSSHDDLIVVAHDFGTPEGRFVEVRGMNDRGAVVGDAFSAVSQQAVPILWTREDGFQKFLGEVGGAATDINDAGTIVGVTVPPVGESTFGFVWNADTGMTDLGTFRPSRINNRGQIVGYCPDPEATGTCIWEAGVFTHVNDGFGRGINERGQVVGGGAGATHGAAFFWSAARGTVVLDDSEFGAAVDINRRREIAGEKCCDATGLNAFAVRWNGPDGTLESLPVAPSSPAGINERGWIAGYFRDAEHELRGFVWLPRRGFIDLGPGQAFAIDNHQHIAGMVPVDNELHMVIWSVRRR